MKTIKHPKWADFLLTIWVVFMIWVTYPLSSRFSNWFNDFTGYPGAFGGYFIFFFLFILIPTIFIGLIIYAIGVKFKWW